MREGELLDSFRRYVSRHELFSEKDFILLTVSGGVDSMVMMNLFAASGFRFAVAHCNFQLRGAEADEDTELVKREAAGLGVTCHTINFDTLAECERTGESVEMAARRLRYAWFEELCQKYSYTAVSVAHHADDSIETFFINLLRGTGLKGLTGISRHNGRIVRPLMFASRKDIMEYAIRHHIPFREDSTNRSTKYLRNKVRLGLIPMIREITPAFTSLMRGNLYRLRDAQRFIEAAIQEIQQQIMHRESQTEVIEVSRISSSYPAEFVLYEILNSQFGFKGDVVTDLYKAYRHSQTGKRFYSRDHVAVVDRGRILVERIREDDPCIIEVERDTLRSYCQGVQLQYEHTDIDHQLSYNLPQEIALLDEQKLVWPLHLRRWQEGDSFIPFGMNGRKKVSDFLTDAKFSMLDRQRQFVLLSGEDIVWLVGERIDDRYRITSKTENILKITSSK